MPTYPEAIRSSFDGSLLKKKLEIIDRYQKEIDENFRVYLVHVNPYYYEYLKVRDELTKKRDQEIALSK